MIFFKNLNWNGMFLTCLVLLVVSAHAQTYIGQTASGGSFRTCDRLRQDISLLFEQVYEKMPSLLNVMMDAAQDPNSGKRVDFGADVMKRMIVNAFTSFLPVCSQQHHRNGQGEVYKATIPSWYFSNLRTHNPPSRYFSKTSSQKQIQDSLPLKLRRKRGSGGGESQPSSDFLYIPLDLFKQQDSGNEEESANQVTLEITV